MFLIDKFHEFYEALLEVDKNLDAGNVGAAAEGHDRLVSLLNRQESEAQREAGLYGLETYRRAKYAMAALGDDILIRHDDAHRERWLSLLLETTLFHSQCAGEKVFDEINDLQRFGSGANASELARVYLAVLGLGFQGVWSVQPDPDAKIDDYRHRLFRLAYGRDPLAIEGQERIVSQAYAATITDGESSRLPHIRPWIYALILIVALYVAGSALLLHHYEADLDPKVRAINDPAGRTSSGVKP